MHRTKKLSALVALVALLTGAAASSAFGATNVGRNGTPTAGYIVQLDPSVADVPAALADLIDPLGGTVEQTFAHAIHGGVVRLPIGAAAGLAATPGVRTVEPNGVMRVVATQPNPPWGLDRTDQRDRPLNQQYSYTTTGAGVDAYIIDTGIRTTHNDFGGRAVSGFDAIDGGAADDCHGHGTHVAGTTGGTTYGIAKASRLVAVRVLNCVGSGTNAQVISGIDWVIANHAAGQAAVANMSLGGGANSAIDTAVRNLHNDGVVVAVAAGNDTADACASSPARAAEAITVAATDQNDAMASFSNGGTCVDIFAPGVGVLSAWSSSDSATNTISGTSMATPHVAGAAARYLQNNPGASPSSVASGLNAAASTGKVTGTGRTCVVLVVLCRPATPTNRLLFAAPTA